MYLVLGPNLIDILKERDMLDEKDGDLYYRGAMVIENNPLPVYYNDTNVSENRFKEKRRLMLEKYNKKRV